jgi:hypothetical protein
MTENDIHREAPQGEGYSDKKGIAIFFKIMVGKYINEILKEDYKNFDWEFDISVNTETKKPTLQRLNLINLTTNEKSAIERTDLLEGFVSTIEEGFAHLIEENT